MITMHEVVHDSFYELGIDPGLQKDGVEAHLQELLAANPHTIEEGFALVRREYPTDDRPDRPRVPRRQGPGRRHRGQAAAATIDGVEQLDPLHRAPPPRSSLGPARGVFVAQVGQARRPGCWPSRGLSVGRGRLSDERFAGWLRDGPGCSGSTSRNRPTGRFRLTEQLPSPAMPQEVRGVVARATGRAGEHRDDRRPRSRPGRGGRRDPGRAGLCHTDLHYREGGINDEFPFLLGHEAAGHRRGGRPRRHRRGARRLRDPQLAGRVRAVPARASAASRGTASPPSTRRRR